MFGGQVFGYRAAGFVGADAPTIGPSAIECHAVQRINEAIRFAGTFRDRP